MNATISVFLIAHSLTAPLPKDPIINQIYFPTKEGDLITYITQDGNGRFYREISAKVSRVESIGPHLNVTLATATDRGLFIDNYKVQVDEAGLKLLWASRLSHLTAIMNVKLPCKNGETWKANYLNIPMREVEFRTEESEVIEVPAGKFLAIRICTNLDGYIPIQISEWYAPNVGLVKSVYKRGDSSNITLLKSFSPAK